MRYYDIKSLGRVAFEHSAGPASKVIVIVPLYNYRQYIIECLESVLRQTMEHVSIVVIDDCSTDDGVALSINFLKRNATRFSSVRVIRHTKNQGLSMARNSGIAWSSEPLLFMLDADNRLRPPALDRLSSAIANGNADFAYSQLFIFGEQSSIGAGDIWHRDRLLRGNTIDAMALIRRQALVACGGYAVLADDHGWEDYDLWCRAFTLGLSGVFVPELLCEYRQHQSSMLNSRTNYYAESLQAEMVIRHPTIFYPRRFV